MTKPDKTLLVEMVPIERISVPNPRVRSNRTIRTHFIKGYLQLAGERLTEY